jgi:hypothetical protein
VTLLTIVDTSLDRVKQRLVIGLTGAKRCSVMFRIASIPIHAVSDSPGLMDKICVSISSAKRTFYYGSSKTRWSLSMKRSPDLILALNPLTEELKARGDLTSLPPADVSHLTNDTRRVYAQLILEWMKYMEYLNLHYPYLFSLAMLKNPFDASASVVVKQET